MYFVTCIMFVVFRIFILCKISFLQFNKVEYTKQNINKFDLTKINYKINIFIKKYS